MGKWWRFFLPVTSIKPQEARKIMETQKGWTLLDVRTRVEYAQGAIEGARLIPVKEIGARCDELDPHTTLIVYCRSGFRSKIASRILATKGFENVKDMAGGIMAWK